MKKIFVLFTVVFTLLLTACGSGTSSAESAGNKPEQSSAESSSGKKSDGAFLEKQVIAEQEGLKVIASYREMNGDPEILFKFENSTGRNLNVQNEEFVVNNYSYRNGDSVIVPADGSKGSMARSSWYLPPGLYNHGVRIENARQVSISFRVFDDDTNEFLFYIPESEIKTDPLEPTDIVKYDEGTELYNEDGLRIVGRYEENNDDKDVVCFIENNSGQFLMVRTNAISINGTSLKPDADAYLNDGRMALMYNTLSQEELDQNQVGPVEEIMIGFDIMTADREIIKTTDMLSFSVK